jgi:hypothetical protein
MGVITIEEATDLYPKKANYIIEISRLYSNIKGEKDLEWAFAKACSILTNSSVD